MSSIRIDKETLVEELMTAYPQTIPVFIKHRTACVGCKMALFDTLGDVISNYDLDAMEFFAEIRAAINQQTVQE